jgi:hypothetical protein
LVENSWRKNYDIFVDSFVQIRGLYENLDLTDLSSLCELPYPLYNDILLKQIEDNKKQKQNLDKIKEKTKVIRKRK